MRLLFSADHSKDKTLGTIPGVLLTMLKPGRRPFVSSASVLLLAIALLLSSPSQLFGYADPGTGAFLYQAVYAAFIGGAFYYRKLLSRIFRKRQ